MRIEIEDMDGPRELKAAQAAIAVLLAEAPAEVSIFKGSVTGITTALVDHDGTDEAPGESDGGSAGHARDAAETGSDQQTTRPEDSPADASNDTDARTDQNGVPFNADYCGEATEPFYKSGPRAGRWKKRRGVEDSAYDKWYAEQLALRHDAGAEQADEPVNTAGAFGGADPEPTAAPAPLTTGDFMGWASEQQAAGRLTQSEIQAAYETTGIAVTDLFPPTPPETVANRIAQLYGILSVKAGL